MQREQPPKWAVGVAWIALIVPLIAGAAPFYLCTSTHPIGFPSLWSFDPWIGALVVGCVLWGLSLLIAAFPIVWLQNRKKRLSGPV